MKRISFKSLGRAPGDGVLTPNDEIMTHHVLGFKNSFTISFHCKMSSCKMVDTFFWLNIRIWSSGSDILCYHYYLIPIQASKALNCESSTQVAEVSQNMKIWLILNPRTQSLLALRTTELPFGYLGFDQNYFHCSVKASLNGQSLWDVVGSPRS